MGFVGVSRWLTRALGAAVAFVLVGVGAIAATASGITLDSSVGRLEDSRVRAGVAQLRDAHGDWVRRSLKAPTLLGVSRRKLERIAECESHGDPRSVSSDGTYRGKYQFDRGTWKSNGGSGDPARASELEQDLRAAALYKAAGSSPWPNCG